MSPCPTQHMLSEEHSLGELRGFEAELCGEQGALVFPFPGLLATPLLTIQPWHPGGVGAGQPNTKEPCQHHGDPGTTHWPFQQGSLAKEGPACFKTTPKTINWSALYIIKQGPSEKKNKNLNF